MKLRPSKKSGPVPRRPVFRPRAERTGGGSNPFGLRTGELIVDHFAGGGGASTGVGMAAGRSPDIAINHDPEAIRMHEVNHPTTRHYIEDIWEVDPVEVCAGRPVGLLWTSPTCTFFSKAKGTALSAEAIRIRGLAWVAVRWAHRVRPRIICLENVEEFAKWGPLHRQHSEGCHGQTCSKNCTFGKKRSGKTIKQHAPGCHGRECKKGCQLHQPIKVRQGELFDKFVAALRAHGYIVEWRLLRACDYGAPTMRRRLFLVARCDGHPICWPEPTHGDGRKYPYRAAAECIDWSDLGQSIFDEQGNTRHVEKTLARLAAGVRRFVIENPKPFLVPMSYGAKGANENRSRSVEEPVPTICGNRGSHAVVTPVIMKAKTYGGGGNVAKSAEEPLSTITCSKRGEHVVGSALLLRTDMHKSNAGCNYSVEEPLRTITTGGGHAVAVPYLIHRSNGERRPKDGKPGQAPRIYDPAKPLGTIMAQGQKHAACAALLIKHNGGNNDRCGAAGQVVDRPVDALTTKNNKSLAAVSLLRYNSTTDGKTRGQVVDEPISTLDTSRRHGLVAAHIVKMRGTSPGHIESSSSSAAQPVPTISAQGTHIAAVSAFLVRYNGGTNIGQVVDQPTGTLTQKPRFALVTVWIEGEEWVIADIYMRMLKPRELYRAQGFPPNYVIDPEYRGKKLSGTAQIRMCGNSVPPQMAEVVARAQLWGTGSAPAARVAA